MLYNIYTHLTHLYTHLYTNIFFDEKCDYLVTRFYKKQGVYQKLGV